MLNITCSNSKKSSRYAFIDYLRGIALLLMFIYHFCFDLDYFNFIQTDFNNNPWWVNFRIIIVSLFLWLVGVSLWLAIRKNINLPRYLKRLSLLAVASAVASYSSYLTFPKSYIFFGILQFILVASIVGLLFVRLYYSNLILGILLIAIGTSYTHPMFNANALQWFGLMTHRPITEDYVPFLPWFGLVLIGIFSAAFIFKKQDSKWITAQFSQWSVTNTNFQRHISCMGRHSLIIYLIHQPIFMGLLYIFSLMLS